MKNLLAVLAVCVTLACASVDAEAAKRFGGGMNLGGPAPTFSQKAPAAPAAAPRPQAQPKAQPSQSAPKPAVAPAPVQKPSMMRSILGGIAAALGISALLSLFGLSGSGIASMVTGLLLAVVAFFAVSVLLGYFARRRMQTAGAQAGQTAQADPWAASREQSRPEEPVAAREASAAPSWRQSGAAGAQGARSGSVMDQFMGGAAAPAAEAAQEGPVDVTPADFDREGFLRTARENYVKLQKAWDTGNVIEISDFTDNDLFTAVTHQLRERKGEVYHTVVKRLENELLGIALEGGAYFASVRFEGELEINGEAETLDETWILRKPEASEGGWLLCGIRQNGPAA